MNETILISIVSYKEIELEHTVKSLYESATHKNRLLFSVVSQADWHPRLKAIPTNQLRYIKVSPEASWGVSWARSLSQASFSQYDYYLQVDAHMFSVDGWDVDIINKHKEAAIKYPNPVLTAYPARYKLEKVDDNFVREVYPGPRHAASYIKGVRFRTWPTHLFAEDLTEVFYIQGACFFAARSFVEDVPIDPEVDFFAEEPVLSIRAFSKGYSVVSFLNPIFYHLYVPERNAINSNIKPWNDGNPNVDYLNNPTRGNAVLRGEIDGVYGVSKEQVDAFANATGYIVEVATSSLGLPSTDAVRDLNDKQG